LYNKDGDGPTHVCYGVLNGALCGQTFRLKPTSDDAYGIFSNKTRFKTSAITNHNGRVHNQHTARSESLQQGKQLAIMAVSAPSPKNEVSAIISVAAQQQAVLGPFGNMQQISAQYKTSALARQAQWYIDSSQHISKTVFEAVEFREMMHAAHYILPVHVSSSSRHAAPRRATVMPA